MATKAQDTRTAMSAAGTRADAVDLAQLLSASTASDLDIILDSDEESIRGPLVIASDLKRDYTPAQLNEFPEVGSWDSEENVPKAEAGAKISNNYEWTKVVRAMPLGGTRDVKHSWFTDFAANTSIGETLSARIDKLRDRVKDQTNADPDADRTALTQDERRMDGVVSKVRRAIDFIQQEQRFKELLDKTVGVYVAKSQMRGDDGEYMFGEADDKGNRQPLMEISRSPNPIKLWDKSQAGMDKNIQRFVSLTQFLSYDVATAMQNGGTYAELLKTVKRDAEEEKDTSKPIALKDLFVTVGRINTLFDQNEFDTALLRAIGKPGTGGPLAAALVELTSFLNSYHAMLKPVAAKWDEAAAAKNSKLAALVAKGDTPEGRKVPGSQVVQAKVL